MPQYTVDVKPTVKVKVRVIAYDENHAESIVEQYMYKHPRKFLTHGKISGATIRARRAR